MLSQTELPGKVFKVEFQVYFDSSLFGPSWPRETISITRADEECAVLYCRVASATYDEWSRVLAAVQTTSCPLSELNLVCQNASLPIRRRFVFYFFNEYKASWLKWKSWHLSASPESLFKGNLQREKKGGIQGWPGILSANSAWMVKEHTGDVSY